MSSDRRWLDLGLEGLAPAQADRVRLFRTLAVAAAALRGRLDRELAPHGVTSQQAAMLQWIDARDEPPSISAVAEGMGMTHQNVKQIVSALERKGFVEIAVDPADRRARRLVLTAHHRRFWKGRNPGDYAAIERWTGALSDAEVRTAQALLGRLYRDLQAQDSDRG